MGQLSENSVINIKNKSHSVTAEITVPAQGREGVIVAQGGNIGGWSLYAKGGKLKYCYNLLGVQYFYVEAASALPTGDHQVRMEFAYDGGGLGKGGTATLYVDGKQGRRGQGRGHGGDGLLRRRRLRCRPRYAARPSRRITGRAATSSPVASRGWRSPSPTPPRTPIILFHRRTLFVLHLRGSRSEFQRPVDRGQVAVRWRH